MGARVAAGGPGAAGGQVGAQATASGPWDIIGGQVGARVSTSGPGAAGGQVGTQAGARYMTGCQPTPGSSGVVAMR